MAFKLYKTNRLSERNTLVSIYSSDQIYLSADALHLLDNPKAVLIYFDEDTRTIGLQAVSLNHPHAYPLAGPYESGNAFVYCVDFLREYELQVRETQRYLASFDNGMLQIHLNERTTDLTY